MALGVGVERALTDGPTAVAGADPLSVPFHGEHQAGIATPAQEQLYFASFDVGRSSAVEVRRLLERWSEAAAVLTEGRRYRPSTRSATGTPSDPGEAVGLPAARLTLTFGFGPGLFEPSRPLGSIARPAALQPLPAFAGDQLDASRSGGDLCVQACADDPQVAFHAIHVLSLLAAPTAVLRWSQDGFRRATSADGAPRLPRNLIGFIDGTNNVRPNDPRALERFVWVQPGDGPAWMAGGSYLIVRTIEIQFSSWDRLTLALQEQTVGRHKLSGDLLGVVPPHAHVRQARPSSNGGQRILRRGYNYSSPATLAQGQVSGGLFFIAFVRNPSRQFVPLQRRLASSDALSAFTLHIGSAVFACPPGPRPGGFVGEALFS